MATQHEEVLWASVPSQIWSLFNGIFRGNPIKIIHVRIQTKSGIIDCKTGYICQKKSTGRPGTSE
jgi:hypothetical protein